MPQDKTEHRNYMRVWRLNQREKQDKIEKQIDKRVEKVSQQPRKRRELTPVDDAWGREPETGLEPQYERKEQHLGCNIWGCQATTISLNQKATRLRSLLRLLR